jgi:hypothetical protein
VASSARSCARSRSMDRDANDNEEF